MQYSVNDQDVQDYLEQLAAQSITVDTDTDTGAQNLKIILDTLEDNLIEIKYTDTEKLNHLIQRKLIIDKRIESLNDNYFNTNALDQRYIKYKQDIRTVNEVLDSAYMTMIQRTIDTSVDSGMRELYNCRREQAYLGYLINSLQEEISYMTDLEDSITTLKSKIDAL